MNYKRFSKKELMDILDVIQASLSCKTEGDFKFLLEKAKGIVGGEHSICGLGIYDAKGLVEAKTIINSTYPQEWLSIYQKKQLYFVDPIVIEQYKSSGTQLWSDTYKKYRSKDISEFIHNASNFGLKYGISSGIKSKCNRMGSIIVFSNNKNYFEEHQKEVMDALIPHLHQALVRIYRQLKTDILSPLTEREMDMVHWVKEGKTNWEISMILKISERTVKFHLDNIKEKLGAVSKTHAVAILMEHEHEQEGELVS
ncbi:MAG: LuxR C-terminal-related transcriptional regulator [Deltaproteobacteria bacterium]|nr:LuxR C-terminal-related transcriptional regulator [Deltaproteobacteria bacterium]